MNTNRLASRSATALAHTDSAIEYSRALLRQPYYPGDYAEVAQRSLK